ncbi:hypothetical protein FQR65_LT10789 [Abscondita terminalis]|nr:hypothetical protein FQR65_LT10789 [Abscondita terminalis]
MSYDVLLKNVPRCDNTKSTNYGTPFEISTAILMLLRCCKRKINAVITLNCAEYAPWDDLVLKHRGGAVCFQLKHTGIVRKDKFKKCLDARKRIRGAIAFVYLTTASAGLRFPRLDEVPTFCDYFLTNNHVLYDAPDTYFCMEQHDVARSHADIYEALQEFVGDEYANKDFLRNLQVSLKEYVHKRFHRFERPDDPLTAEEVRRFVGYAFLSQYVIPYAYPSNNHTVSKDLKEVLKEKRIVVLNHRTKSAVIKQNVWKYLVKLPRGKHHLCTEWGFDEKIHMPLFSPTVKTDRRILRGMEMLVFECKVMILRPRSFKVDEKGGILNNLKIIGTIKIGEDDFNYVEVQPDEFLESDVEFHNDLFCKMAREFNAGGRRILEAHDESGYVNEVMDFGGEMLTPLIAMVKTVDVGVFLVEDLARRGANLNAFVGGGFTALYYAAKNDRADIVETLLRRGARPDPVDNIGNTPLFAACVQGKTKIVDLLLKHGADRNKAGADGLTPIFLAYKTKQYEILDLLLRGHNNPTAADVKGRHIVHLAAMDGDVECLRRVLRSGIEIRNFITGDADGKNPIRLASEHGHVEFAELIRKSL